MFTRTTDGYCHPAAQSEEWRLSCMIRATNLGTWEWNILTGEARCNNKWAEMLGWTLDELAPVSFETWRALTHPDDAHEALAQAQRHFDGFSTFYDCDIRMRHKNGHWVWLHDRGQLIARTEDNKPFLMFGTHTDISKRKASEAEQARLIHELRQALEQAKTLRGIVPICGHCKKIRDGHGNWQQVETYIARHTEAQFSHGLCPDCFTSLYPDLIEQDRQCCAQGQSPAATV